MKKVLVVLLSLAVWGLSASVFAETNRSQIELTRSMIQTQKQAIVTKNLELTPTESEAFWPMYRDFQSQLLKVNDRRVKVIEEFASNYETMSDPKAQQIMDEHMNWEKDVHQLKQSYMKKFSKVLPPKKVARYFQLENKMDAVINYELAANLPLVK